MACVPMSYEQMMQQAFSLSQQLQYEKEQKMAAQMESMKMHLELLELKLSHKMAGEAPKVEAPKMPTESAAMAAAKASADAAAEAAAEAAKVAAAEAAKVAAAEVAKVAAAVAPKAAEAAPQVAALELLLHDLKSKKEEIAKRMKEFSAEAPKVAAEGGSNHFDAAHQIIYTEVECHVCGYEFHLNEEFAASLEYIACKKCLEKTYKCKTTTCNKYIVSEHDIKVSEEKGFHLPNYCKQCKGEHWQQKKEEAAIHGRSRGGKRTW